MLQTAEPNISPAASHILQSLENRILSGEFQAGARFPAERALAEEYQVSRTIIRQSLETLERRGYLLRANGFRPLVCIPGNPERTAPPIKRNVAVWITGEPNDVGAAAVLQGIQHALDPECFRIVISSPRGGTLKESTETEARFLKLVSEDPEIGGAILWYLGGESNRHLLDRLRSLDFPMVFVDRRPPDGFAADYIGVDNRHAAEQVVRYLISRGHTRIAHITNEEAACTVADRRAGYRDALESAGLPYDEDLVLSGPFQEPEEPQYSAIIDRIRRLAPPATAVFAVNDYTALCLAANSVAKGLRVPQDLEIAGFDDLERWRPDPAMITTASQPFERIGAQAARLLIQRMDGPAVEAYSTVIMDAPLVVRTNGSSNHESIAG